MNEKPSISYDAAIGRIIDILARARLHPEMYFDPITPEVVIDFLSGLRIGLSVFGLEWCIDSRRTVLESRGLEFNSCNWENKELRERGLGPDQIVTEILSIEIEMWERYRSSICSAPQS
jgi:hypothetical protein